jgi:hypothetical protein
VRFGSNADLARPALARFMHVIFSGKIGPCSKLTRRPYERAIDIVARTTPSGTAAIFDQNVVQNRKGSAAFALNEH